MKYQDLIEETFKVMENAYAPYSNYKVGSIVLSKDGRKFYGVNVENASYGATNCGERSAIFNAYSNGIRKEDIEVITIVTSGNTLGYPCGICRQVLSELLNGDTLIILANKNEVKMTNMNEILPFSFSSEDLK